jgi:hypothetical protein
MQDKVVLEREPCRISRRDLDALSFAIQTTALDWSGVVTKTPSSSRQGDERTAASHDHITPSVSHFSDRSDTRAHTRRFRPW